MNDTDDEHRVSIGDRVKIYRRGKKGTWTAEFQHSDSHRRKSLGTSNKKVATERATRLAAELAGGTYQAPKRVRLREGVDRYLEFLRTEDRADRTVTRYRGELERFVEFAESRRVRRLDAVGVSLLDQYRAERSRDCAPATVYHESVVIKQLFKWAKRRGLLATNPVADYRLNKPRLISRPALSLEQVNAILRQCSERQFRMLATLAFTGMRVSSLQVLERRDVDLEGGWLTVRDVKKRQQYKLPIHSRLLAVLQEARREDKDHELLFTARPSRKYPEGGRPINAKRLNEYFKAAAERAGITGFTLHDLRHFFKSFTVNSGVPERAVDIWLNHADGSVRQRYYHLSPEESQAFMEAVPFGETAETNTTEALVGRAS